MQNWPGGQRNTSPKPDGLVEQRITLKTVEDRAAWHAIFLPLDTEHPRHFFHWSGNSNLNLVLGTEVAGKPPISAVVTMDTQYERDSWMKALVGGNTHEIRVFFDKTGDGDTETLRIFSEPKKVGAVATAAPKAPGDTFDVENATPGELRTKAARLGLSVDRREEPAATRQRIREAMAEVAAGKR